MFKVEFYKLLHSINLLILLGIVIPVAIFLGMSIQELSDQFNGNGINNLLNIGFISSAAILMIYETIYAIMYINRDYMVNNYRVLVSIGMNRNNIILMKYIYYQIFGILIILTHIFITLCVANLNEHITVSHNIIIDFILYIIIYIAILSIIFLLSIIGKTVIKSIILNIIFIMISGITISIQLPTNGYPIFPMQSLQAIANKQTDKFEFIVIISLVYIIITYCLAQLIFKKQEL